MVRASNEPGSIFRGWLCLMAICAGWMSPDGGRLFAAGPRHLAVTNDVTAVKTLSQNWSDAESNWFYSVPQGSKLIPYSWFLHLEQPDSQAAFRDAGHIRSLGYLPRTPDSDGNPDGLPIGFTKDGSSLGFTCAACHTNQINFQGTAWLIDGAPTLADFESFLRRLESALDQMSTEQEKFDRFASNVLGRNASNAAKSKLKSQLLDVLAFRRAYNQRNLPAAGGAAFGPGRVDAFGAIMNEVTATFAQVSGNHSPADAPVSYPFLWDAPQHDRVQWNGAAENNVVVPLRFVVGTIHVGALGRNAGEVLGVFGQVDASAEGSLLQLRGYASSVNRPNLIEIEESLRTLWSPEWPAEFPPIDESLRASGQALFAQHCQSCHAPIQRKDPGRVVQAMMRAVGTDQKMAANFATRKARSGVLEGRKRELQSLRRLREREAVADLLTHMVQRVVVRQPRSPEIAFDRRSDRVPVAFFGRLAQPAEGGSNETDRPLGPEQVPAALQAMMSWSPEYRIFAEIDVGERSLTAGFRDLEMADGQVRKAVSPAEVRLEQGDRSFRLDTGSFDDAARFVAPDGESVLVEDLSGVRSEFTPSGTRLTFEEPARISFAYKGRPLNGIWATAPYLHNGSVPNLDELLKPAGQRVRSFKVGSREFDPVKVGFVDQGGFEFDTALPGNSNAGHEYGVVFTDAQRAALIEYLKSL